MDLDLLKRMFGRSDRILDGFLVFVDLGSRSVFWTLDFGVFVRILEREFLIDQLRYKHTPLPEPVQEQNHPFFMFR